MVYREGLVGKRQSLIYIVKVWWFDDKGCLDYFSFFNCVMNRQFSIKAGFNYLFPHSLGCLSAVTIDKCSEQCSRTRYLVPENTFER